MACVRHAILCESILADGIGIASIVNIVRELGERALPWESAFYWVFWIDSGIPNEEVTICTDVLFRGVVQISDRTVVRMSSSTICEAFLRIGPVTFTEPGEYTFRIGILDVPNPVELKAELTRAVPGSASRSGHIEFL